LTKGFFTIAKRGVGKRDRVNNEDDFHLELEFSTWEMGVFDARPYLEKSAF
jgi:hypothetical protein